jgi:hypothetical protein
LSAGNTGFDNETERNQIEKQIFKMKNPVNTLESVIE